MVTIHVYAGKRWDGSRVDEELLVEPCGARRYKLLRSPGLVMGLAADDEFELDDDHKARVLTRGGNISVQLFCRDPDALEHEASRVLGELGARLDGKSHAQLVYTVHVRIGFASLERVLAEIASQSPGTEWYFGNVYGDDGVTPLDWWR